MGLLSIFKGGRKAPLPPLEKPFTPSKGGEIKQELTDIVTLGGKVKVNSKMSRYYFGTSKAMSKEKLFGKAGEGPLLIGMPHTKGEMAEASVESDTSADLLRELMEKGLTREEARRTISDLLREGVLREVYDPDRKQKVLVLG